MSNVVSFPDKGGGPSLEGPVRCAGCRHEWRAVTPTGEFEDLECPACGAHKGIRLGLILPEDRTYWECHCGCMYFMLTPTGAPMCVNCGTRAVSWAGD